MKMVEIASAITDSSAIRNDFSEMSELIGEYLRKKYLNQLESALKSHEVKVSENPTREIALFNSLKPFVPKENHQNIDKMVDVLNTLAIVNSIGSELGMKSMEMDRSFHEDGVYDVDENCELDRRKMENASKLLLLLPLLGMKK